MSDNPLLAAWTGPFEVPPFGHISPAHFSRQFRATFGESPHRYLQRRRVERAGTRVGPRRNGREQMARASRSHGARSKVVCDALLLDEYSRSDTYPTIRIGEDDVNVGHEATVSKVGDDQLFYLMSHGIPEDEASKLIVNGFIEPITKELPMEYAVEMNRLIELQMEGSIG